TANSANYPAQLFAYARCAAGAGAVGVVVSNFAPTTDAATNGTILLTQDVVTQCALGSAASLQATLALDETGAPNTSEGTYTTAALLATGLHVTVGAGATNVYVVR